MRAPAGQFRIDNISTVSAGPFRTAGGFAGTWHDPQTGIGRVVDKTGGELPDPEGYFCASRASTGEPSLRSMAYHSQHESRVGRLGD